MGSLKDIDVIVERYKEMLLRKPNHKILHLECGDGKITREYLSSIFTESEIVGVDVSDELVHTARDSHMCGSLRYSVLDILRDSEVRAFEETRGQFDKVICFSCSSWAKDPEKALTNIKLLMKEDAECFFAFVGRSPVYDTFDRLGRDPRWTEFMEGYENLVPCFRRHEDPECGFLTLVTDANFDILHCESMEPVIFRPSVETLNRHIMDLNPFIRGIPVGRKSDYIKQFRENLYNSKVVKCLHYKLVVLLAKNIPEFKKPEQEHCVSTGSSRHAQETMVPQQISPDISREKSEAGAKEATNVKAGCTMEETSTEETGVSSQEVTGEKTESATKEASTEETGTSKEVSVEKPGSATEEAR